jgi:hypothetical protein
MKKSNLSHSTPLLVIVIIAVLLTQCSSPGDRITTKIVTVTNGTPTEEISYLDDYHLEFELLPLGTGESFMAIQQNKRIDWSSGEANAKFACIIDDTVTQVSTDVIIPVKEFQNRKEFFLFMSSKGYAMTSENKKENKISFDRKKANIRTPD